MSKFKIAVIFGTRPEAIKMASVIKELKKYGQKFKTTICVTGQHRKMLDQVLSIFDIKPDIDLNLMEENQSLESLTANAIRKLSETIKNIKPDLILVQGDTTTAMVAALAAFYQKVSIGHIEAGLRTRDKYNPFPEEINRHLISVLATYHFAPTKKSVKSLLEEGIPKNRVFLTGNTIVDALHMMTRKNLERYKSRYKINGKRLILVTAHRRENFGEPLKRICYALKEIVRKNPNVRIIYPVHMNPNVRKPVYEILGRQKRIKLTQPLGYLELINLIRLSSLVLTDSGGIQEEAPVFGKPVLVLREETERPEGVEAKVAKLVGTSKNKIIRETELLLNNKREYLKMAKATSPYGDGKAAQRIIKIIKKIVLEH